MIHKLCKELVNIIILNVKEMEEVKEDGEEVKKKEEAEEELHRKRYTSGP